MSLPPVVQAPVAIGLIYTADGHLEAVQAAIGFSIFGYMATNYLIPRVSHAFIKIGLSGKDLSKPGKPVLPETIGAIAATVFLFTMFLFIPSLFYKYLAVSTTGGGNRSALVSESGGFPHNKLAEFLSAILCLESTILLGIADDLFDLRWRHKFFLPAFAAIPLLVVYYVDFGVTSVLVPQFLAQYLKRTSVDLGFLYYVYMGAVAIFCPNSINILAGVNGLEVGQSVVLGAIFLINDCLYLLWGDQSTHDAHILSASMIIPFLGVSLALLKYNWWPAKVFVGDTYCYFAGMVFAVVGILGHFSKTTLLFFIPQIFNFCYSVPQLLGVVFCPRHRMPRFHNGVLYFSEAEFKEKPLKPWMAKILILLSKIGLVHVTVEKNVVTKCSNLTLINLVLTWTGPLREDKLCITLLGIQFAIGLLAIIGRHYIGAVLFGFDNLFRMSIVH